jgi:hypothetical protein
MLLTEQAKGSDANKSGVRVSQRRSSCCASSKLILKWAAHHQTRRTNPSADSLERASGSTRCFDVAKTIKNRGDLI